MFQYWALSYLQSLFSLHNWSKHGEILMWKVLQEGSSRHCKGWCSFNTVVGGWSPGFRSPVKHMHFAKNGETSVSRNTQVIHKASKDCYPILQIMPWCWESGYRPCGHSAGATRNLLGCCSALYSLCSYSDTSLHKYAQNWRLFHLKQLGTFWVTGHTWIDTPYWQCCESWWFCVVAYCLFCQVNPKSVCENLVLVNYLESWSSLELSSPSVTAPTQFAEVLVAGYQISFPGKESKLKDVRAGWILTEVAWPPDGFRCLVLFPPAILSSVARWAGAALVESFLLSFANLAKDALVWSCGSYWPGPYLLCKRVQLCCSYEIQENRQFLLVWFRSFTTNLPAGLCYTYSRMSLMDSIFP